VRLRQAYGAHPLHLLSLLACFALAGYAALQASRDPLAWRMGLWFLGALIAHDLVLFPLYALVDRSLSAALPRRRRLPSLGGINYVRVPALLSGLLLLMFFPVILRKSEGAYGAASGLDQSPYLARWLLVTGLLFATSAIAYVVAARRRTS
jgi:ABC-type transport system involved in cytochrome c biogenesis permease component